MINCGVGRDTAFLSDEVMFTSNRVNSGCIMILRYIPAKTAKHQNSRPRPTVGPCGPAQLEAARAFEIYPRELL